MACTPQDGGGETASLEVSPKSLTFGAEDTTPQEITVTATGVEWEYTVPSSADWITVDDGRPENCWSPSPRRTRRPRKRTDNCLDNDDLDTCGVKLTMNP